MVALLSELDAPSRAGLPAAAAANPAADRIAESTVAARIAPVLAALGPAASVAAALRALIAAGTDALPLPGGGATLARWQALETVARHDLALVKLYEGHTDALAILAEIEPGRARSTARPAYAVWASESREDPVTIVTLADADETGGRVRIRGRKSWCSGARFVDRALMTVLDADGGRRLVEVALDEPGVAFDDGRWQAVGMRDSDSVDVLFDGAHARLVGGARAYLDRPGFWHGGAGIAACWFGAAAAIGTRVRDLQRDRDDVHALAHLGTIDTALAGTAALLRECAYAIDAHPDRDAMRIALRVRAAAAETARVVAEHAGRAVGPGPLCNDARLARLVADLPIFVRQWRAEHDLVAQARAAILDDDLATGWSL